MNTSLSKVHWEVWINFEWGTTVKTTYATRKLAREGLAITKQNYTFEGKIPSYYSFKVYKVTHLGGLSSLSGDGVYSFKESR